MDISRGDKDKHNSALVFVPGFTSKSIEEYSSFLTHKRKNMVVFPFVDIYFRATDRFGDKSAMHIFQFVELLEEFIQEERLEEKFEYIDYCGHSFGGGVVLNAVKSQSNVDKVVAINPLLNNEHGLLTIYSVGFASYLGSRLKSLRNKARKEDTLDKIVRGLMREGKEAEKGDPRSQEYREILGLYENVVDYMVKREQSHPLSTQSPLASYPSKQVAEIVSNYQYTRRPLPQDTEVLLVYGSKDKYFKPKPKYRENIENRIPSLASIEIIGGNHHSGYRNRKSVTIIDQFLREDLESMKDACFPHLPQNSQYRSDRRILLRNFKKPD